MPKQYNAQSIRGFNSGQFVRDGEAVIGFTIQVEVNYGSMNLTHMMDLWPYLNDAQKASIQALHDRIKAFLNQYYLDIE